MVKSNTILFGLFAAIVLTGCRTAKPTVMSEASMDSLTISTNTSIGVRHDSIIISEKTERLTDEKVEFMEGGGSVVLSDDGTLYMSGVAAVRSSRLKSSERKEESKSQNVKTQSNDSVVTTNRSILYSESKYTASDAGGCRRFKAAIVAFIILNLIAILIRLRRGRL